MTRVLVFMMFLLLPVVAQAQERMLVIGDSILAWNRLNGNSIPQILDRMPQYQVTSRAFPGAAFSHSGNLRSMLQREIRAQLPRGQWDVILLNGGANDLARECDCNRCATTLDRMVSADGAWHAVGPRIEVVSKVGAGDSFVGAFALALARGEPVADCLKVGVVAAGAACTTLGTRLCEKATVDALLPDAVLTRL